MKSDGLSIMAISKNLVSVEPQTINTYKELHEQ